MAFHAISAVCFANCPIYCALSRTTLPAARIVMAFHAISAVCLANCPIYCALSRTALPAARIGA
ncbi:MAG: hypothetical protein PUK76_11705, partial [Treponema sp.]|nr:hypothetical protein [Treponema sp.]